MVYKKKGSFKGLGRLDLRISLKGRETKENDEGNDFAPLKYRCCLRIALGHRLNQ